MTRSARGRALVFALAERRGIMTRMASAELVPNRGVLVAGKYLLRHKLASGGMGLVWVAHHEQLDIDVAIKFMDPELAASQALRARFEREARAAAKLKTKHVVQVLDHGVDGSLPYIAMELLEGEDLNTRLRRVGRLPLEETLGIVAQIGKGLAQAHAANIVHRDLKPANVFLTRIDGEEMCKLLDFGVAKMSASHDGGESTRTGIVVGSPNYMSPEQARSTHVDKRTDLWSLAVILFRCLTGQNPFKGQTTADVIVKVCAEAIPSPSSLSPDLPPCIDAFFVRALQRAPENRFQDVGQLVEAFARAVEEARGARSARVEGVLAPARTSSAPEPPELEGAEPATAVARATTAWGGQPLHEPARDRAPSDLGLSPGSVAAVMSPDDSERGPHRVTGERPGEGRPKGDSTPDAAAGGTLTSAGTTTSRALAPRASNPRVMMMAAGVVLVMGAVAVGVVATGGSTTAPTFASPSAARTLGTAAASSAESGGFGTDSPSSTAPTRALPPAPTASAGASASDSTSALAQSASAARANAAGSAPPVTSVRPTAKKPPSWGF